MKEMILRDFEVLHEGILYSFDLRLGYKLNILEEVNVLAAFLRTSDDEWLPLFEQDWGIVDKVLEDVDDSWFTIVDDQEVIH